MLKLRRICISTRSPNSIQLSSRPRVMDLNAMNITSHDDCLSQIASPDESTPKRNLLLLPLLLPRRVL